MRLNLELLRHTWFLGLKEFRSLAGDKAMLFLIIFMFTGAVYSDARSRPESLFRAAVAVVDEDQSQLSERIIAALHPPQFIEPVRVSLADMDRGMDAGLYTFLINIPPGFQRDVLAGKAPALQLNVDATRLSQAQTGTGYIQNIVNDEIRTFAQRYRAVATQPVELVTRAMFNPNLSNSWFTAVTSIINNVTMLGILLTGAALLREREHGTIEHLLVMPVTPLEIMLSKVWSMSVVVLCGGLFALLVMVRGVLGVHVSGSILLFAAGTLLYLFSTTSLGIFLGTIARSMPQFGLLVILVLLPLIVLSGAITPTESMPELVRYVMSLAPTIHFVAFAQGVLFRGAGLSTMWPTLLAIAVTGSVFFWVASARLRRTIGQMG